MGKGYILLHRQIWDNDIWQEKEPFDKRAAWIDLLLMANHGDKQLIYGMTAMTIKRGQLHTSVGHLAKRWGWSYKKVVRFLDLLKSLEMVQTDGRANGTTITLVNYSVYQDSGQANDRTNDRTNNRATDRSNDRATDRAGDRQTNNVINNERKNERKNESNNVRNNKCQTAEDINALFEKMKREGKL